MDRQDQYDRDYSPHYEREPRPNRRQFGNNNQAGLTTPGEIEISILTIEGTERIIGKGISDSTRKRIDSFKMIGGSLDMPHSFRINPDIRKKRSSHDPACNNPS